MCVCMCVEIYIYDLVPKGYAKGLCTSVENKTLLKTFFI